MFPLSLLNGCRIQRKFASQSDHEIYKLNRTISRLIRGNQIVEARCTFDHAARRNVITWNAMISGYVSTGDFTSARELFDKMSHRDSVTWNLMISGYVRSSEPRHLEEGRCVLDMMPQPDHVSWNTMINGYMLKGMITEAMNMFDKMPNRNIVSWNSIISGFLRNGDICAAVNMFRRMAVRDSATLCVMISGLISNGKLDDAAEFLMNESTQGNVNPLNAFNTLIAAYGHRGRIKDAQLLFGLIPEKASLTMNACSDDKVANSSTFFEKNTVSWNTMMMCYVKIGDLHTARKLFDMMPARDSFSWNTMISAYARAGNIEEASNLFGEMPCTDTRSWNAMISGYAQKGDVQSARAFFDKLTRKSLVSWNSMIAAYELSGVHETAIELFLQLKEAGEKPDSHTLSSILSACGGLSGHYQGMQIHQLLVKTLTPDTPLSNSLITMYAKCGNIKDATLVFKDMKNRDYVSWNAVIGGFAQNGLANEALEAFQEMKKVNIIPTSITFLSVLSACGHAGFVEEGKNQFNSMVHDFGIVPSIEHFASLVDMMGRCGKLKHALELIKSMPMEPNGCVWGALLAASKIHKNVRIASVAAMELMRIEPESSAPYTLLRNVYVDRNQWDTAMMARQKMEKKGIKKQQGYSRIELYDRIYQFVSGDKHLPNIWEMHWLLILCDKISRDVEHDDSWICIHVP